MEINRVGSRPSVKGPPDWFTGSVNIDPLFQTSQMPHVLQEPQSPSSRVREPRGVRIP